MSGSRRSSFPMQITRRAGAACLLLLAVSLAAAAQTAQPAPPPQPAPPAYQPGMLEGITRWFRDGYEGAKNTMTGIGTRAGDAAKDAANATKDAASAATNAATSAASNAATAAKDAASGAADAVARLPGGRVIAGKSRCDLAPNGGPDCGHAAEALCRSKGFAGGKSLDITAAKDCPTEAYIRRETRDCKVASFVTRAICQ